MILYGGDVTFKSFFGSTTSITLVSSAGILFENTASISSLFFSGNNYMYIQPGATVNITDVFSWSGSDSYITNSVGVGGVLNLLPACRTTLKGAGSSQYIAWVQINNYGFIDWAVQSTALFYFSYSTVFNNFGTFNVNMSVAASVGISSDYTARITNNGTWIVNLRNFLFQFSVPLFHNGLGGVVNLSNGNFYFASSQPHFHSGQFNAPANCQYRFANGQHNFLENSPLITTKGFLFNGGEINIYTNKFPSFNLVKKKKYLHSLDRKYSEPLRLLRV